VIDVSSSAVLIELPKPSAFALRSIERHRGTFEESLPTLRFRKPRVRAHRERIELAELVELLEVVPAQPVVVPAQPVVVPAEPVEREAMVAAPPPVATPTWNPPIVRGHTQPYRHVPVRPAAPPDWSIVLACWLASFVLAAALWIGTA